MDTGLKNIAWTLLHLGHVLLMNWVFTEEEFLEPQGTEHGREEIQKRRNSVTKFFGGTFLVATLYSREKILSESISL